jgi:hypothetical protein
VLPRGIPLRAYFRVSPVDCSELVTNSLESIPCLLDCDDKVSLSLHSTVIAEAKLLVGIFSECVMRSTSIVIAFQEVILVNRQGVIPSSEGVMSMRYELVPPG